MLLVTELGAKGKKEKPNVPQTGLKLLHFKHGEKRIGRKYIARCDIRVLIFAPLLLSIGFSLASSS